MDLVRHTCKECIWKGDCYSDYPCEHFSPSDEDIYVDYIIEKERQSFYDEWNKYITDRG